MRLLFGCGRRDERAANASREFYDSRQAGGVRTGAARDLDHEIVARDFTLQVDAPRDPAHHWMEYENRFDHALDEQCEIVATRQMRGLVQSDLLQFARVKF